MSKVELENIVALKESLEPTIAQIEESKQIIAAILERCPSVEHLHSHSGSDELLMDPRRVLACMAVHVEIYNCIISLLAVQTSSETLQAVA